MFYTFKTAYRLGGFDFIETEFIDSIRRDESVDNIDYVIDMMNALQIMRFAAYRNRGRCAEAYLCQFN